MQSSRAIKHRIKSVSNISQITKAMEMVSASKMRQAQFQAMASRVYSRKIDEVLRKIALRIDTKFHPLLSSNTDSKKEALLIMSTDKGLTGSLNTNLFKYVSGFQNSHHADIYTLGRQARKFTIKSGFNLVADFGKVPEHITYDLATPISDLLIKEFTQGNYRSVWLCYMDFISTLDQKPRMVQLLPISQNLDESTTSTTGEAKEYIFEPDPQTILNWILPYFIELTIYQSLLEARASEHSARMVAMKNASENASELVDDLQMIYNRSRQTSITNELLDITTASLTLTA